MTIGERIKLRRESLGLSQEELAKRLGYKSRSSINKIELGSRDLTQSKIKAIADALETTPSYIMGWDDEWEEQQNLDGASNNEILTPDGKHVTFKSPTVTENTVTFPVIGEIAAGYDSIVLEEWCGETVEIPRSYLRGRDQSDFIVLTVKGNSMYPLYLDGDKVLILKQSMVSTNGEVCAVIYDSEIGTLKKVFVHQDEENVELVPINPEYMPKTISGYDLENFKIIGIPKLLIREIV